MNLTEQRRQNVDNLLIKIRQKLESYKDRNEIEIRNPSQVNKTTLELQPTGTNELISKKLLISNYKELLIGKVRDRGIATEAINYSQLIIQPKSYVIIELYDNGKPLASITTYLILPEHAQIITNYWIGQVIESNNLEHLTMKYATIMQSFNCGKSTSTYMNSGKVTNVRCVFNLA